VYAVGTFAHEHHEDNIPEGSVISPEPLDSVLWVHIVIQIIGWGVVFPTGMVLGVSLDFFEVAFYFEWLISVSRSSNRDGMFPSRHSAPSSPLSVTFWATITRAASSRTTSMPASLSPSAGCSLHKSSSVSYSGSTLTAMSSSLSELVAQLSSLTERSERSCLWWRGYKCYSVGSPRWDTVRTTTWASAWRTS